ncbi:MAG: ABC transporter permease subunit [Nitriliruptorales bacterium]|nr:ABC transporter permease subunit [Nitriliruptorales bacterium]
MSASTRAPAPLGVRTEVLREERHRHQGARKAHHRFLITARIGILAVALVLWESASGTLVRPFFVSSPTAVVAALWAWAQSGELWYHGRFTLTATALGYVLGSVAAIALAWPLGAMRTLYRVTEPYFLVAYSVPAVAMGPVFILWFGLGLAPKVVLAAYFVFFIVFINTVTGFQQVPQGLLDVTRVMGASRWATLRTVIFPSAVPYVLAALRITLPAAMIGAVVGEFIASNRGLGYLTRAAASRYSTAGVIGGVLVLGAIVLAMSLLLRPLRNALRWQPDISIRGGDA